MYEFNLNTAFHNSNRNDTLVHTKERKFTILFKFYAATSSSKNYVSKKFMDGTFNRFLSSVKHVTMQQVLLHISQ